MAIVYQVCTLPDGVLFPRESLPADEKTPASGGIYG